MKFSEVDPPREFGVGYRGATIKHVADLSLGDDEQVTLRTDSGTELDVVRKSWGYYATPSMNGRLAEHGLRAALVIGVPREGEAPERMYLLLVERGHQGDFEEYAEAEGMRVVAWLDDDQAVAEAARRLRAG